MLKSLLPETIVTVRVSGFHPESGSDTVTVWSPREMFTLVGVTLPVSIPSMTTVAPAGYDVIFSEPLPCARAATGITPMTSRHTPTLSILIAHAPSSGGRTSEPCAQRVRLATDRVRHRAPSVLVIG